MVVEDLIVTAEDVCTGKTICGYVCGCKSCRESKLKTEVYDKSRPTGLMTDPDGEWGGIRVYLDTLKPLKPRISNSNLKERTMEGIYYDKVNTSRNQLKLKKKLEEMGHTNVEVWWEPVSSGCEMGGYDGGVFFHSDQNELEPLGYSYEEANEYIENSKLFEVDRDDK